MRGSKKALSRGDLTDFDSGGAWLYSVFLQLGDRMVGFFHSEDHRFAGDPYSTFIVHKSIARSESTSGGPCWKKDSRILTGNQPKAEKPAWSGLCNHCTILGSKERRYICAFQEEGILFMAISSDPEGKPGTWYKWFEGQFSKPQLGGRVTPILNFVQTQGGNPSVHWNTFLRCWVKVCHIWPGNLAISQSADLISWSVPTVLLEVAAGTKVWYPTVIAESDAVAGEHATMFCAYSPDIKK